MPGNWGNLDCPACGATHPVPERASNCECDEVVADLLCPQCGQGWELRVALWRYYEIDERLPSPAEDR
jgi:hypothetical protein